jgi:peptide/nickel transport system substrate-binding protein
MPLSDQYLPRDVSGRSLSDLTRRKFIGLMGAGTVGLLAADILAACGVSSSPGSAGGSPKRGGTLRFASTGGGGSSDTLNPIYALYDPDLARAHQIFDQPMHFDTHGAPQPGLIEELTANADATVWTARLRKGVTFHNGKDLTADDLIYTFQQITNKDKPGTGAGAIAQVDVAGMKKLDSLTVQIPCKSSFSILPSVICGVYYYVIPVGFDPAKPVGTGPFKYSTFTAGGESVHLRNPNYWQSGKPYVDEIHITDFNDETSMLNALLAGQMDLANLSNAVEAGQVRSAGGNYVVSKTGSFVPFVMAVGIPPLNDQRVRTALRLIVDRPQLNTAVYGGLGSIGNDVFGVGDPLYDSSLPQRHQDIEQAKSLLKQAGVSSLNLNLTTGAIGPGAPQAAQVYAEQARAAGVNVTVQTMTSTAFFADTWLHRPFTQDWWFNHPYLATVGLATGPAAAYNETQFKDPHYNDLYSQALATADPAKLKSIVHEMMRIDYDTGGYIIPAFLPSIDCFTKKVHGVGESVLGIPFNEYDFKSLWIE